MKKFYLFLMTAAATMSVAAQQLPGADFEQSWVNCIPWTSNNNTKVQGTTPSPWNLSNTVGMGGTGATTVGSQIDGFSGKGVFMENKSILGNVIPGYFTLGKPWSTAVGMVAKNKDGGTFGGVEFNYRPDAISFYYQSTGATDRPTVVAYSWKGTYEQASVPGNIVLSGSATKVTMTDRDRCVLNMFGGSTQGGSVTAEGTRIGVINTRLNAEQPTWKQEVIPFEYSSIDTPEKINVIFSVGDYFSSSPVNNNSLSVDEVKLLYYSRLASLSVNGTAVAGFESDKYEYDLSDVEMPAVNAVTYNFLGTSGSQNASVETNRNVMKITVSNSNAGGVDVDGEATHTYTLTFKEQTVVEMPAYAKGYFDGSVSVSFESFDDEYADVFPDYTLQITQMQNDPSMCVISIPDFHLAERPEDESDEEAMADYEAARVGDIVVNNVTWSEVAGGVSFYGVEPNLSLSLMGMDIVARVVVNGTIDDSGKCNLNIDVVWLDEDNEVPIYVSFNGERNVAGIDSVIMDNSNYPVEYYNINGMRVNGDNLKSGIYIVRQGKDVKKILVK